MAGPSGLILTLLDLSKRLSLPVKLCLAFTFQVYRCLIAISKRRYHYGPVASLATLSTCRFLLCASFCFQGVVSAGLACNCSILSTSCCMDCMRVVSTSVVLETSSSSFCVTMVLVPHLPPSPIIRNSLLLVQHAAWWM